MFRKVLLGVILSILVLAGTSMAAVTLPADKTINVSASVAGSIDFTVAIYKSNGKDGSGNATFDWATNLYPNVAFGNLIPGDATKPTTSALAGANSFAAYIICTNNSGLRYRVKYTGASLALNGTSTTVKLSDDAWTIVGGPHTGATDGFNTANTAGIDQTVRTASSTYDIYTSTTTGTTDVFRAYFGITGDPATAVGAKALIPPTQQSGSYSGTVKLTMYNY